MFKKEYLTALVVISIVSISSCFEIKRYPSNLMLDFNWPVPDENIKKYPHEKYCHYYYNRETADIFTIRKCPRGEMFDYHRHQCIDKNVALCWSIHYGKHAVHDHIHSTWRKHFKCPFPNGNYPDIFDCEKYIVCLDGEPHHKHCSPNQQFDKIRRHCVYVAVCANSTDAALVGHMCPYSSGKFGHLEDCSKYYKCHDSQPRLKTCKENMLFDEEDRQCKDKELVHCGDRPNPYGNQLVTQSTAHPEETKSSLSSMQSVFTDRVSSKSEHTSESIKQSEVTNNQLFSQQSTETAMSTEQSTERDSSPSAVSSENKSQPISQLETSSTTLLAKITSQVSKTTDDLQSTISSTHNDESTSKQSVKS